MSVRIKVEDHDNIAVHPVDALGAEAVGSVLDGQGAPVGRADHEDVLGARIGAAGRDVGQPANVDAVDLVVEVPAVPRCATDQHDEHHAH